jgi:hypothetical protein
VAKPNYRFMKKQKESARIARQQEKLTRKLARASETPPEGADAATDAATTADTAPPTDGERNQP